MKFHLIQEVFVSFNYTQEPKVLFCIFTMIQCSVMKTKVLFLFLLILLANKTFAQQEDIYVPSDSLQAKFPGGRSELVKYLADSLKYAVDFAERQGYKGTVFVKFIVEKDGSLSQVEILKGIYPEIDKIVKSTIEEMPKWIPGEIDGKPVRVQNLLPIKFDFHKRIMKTKNRNKKMK